MHFLIEQDLDGALEDVETAFFDPAFLAGLAAVPNLAAPQLLSQERTDGVIHQRVRYRFTGELNRAVSRAVDRDRLTWIEDSTFRRPLHRTDWTVLPDHYADRLSCSGSFELSPAGSRTHRVADGELTVHVPLVGGRVERAIVSGLREHARAECELMSSWLAARS